VTSAVRERSEVLHRGIRERAGERIRRQPWAPRRFRSIGARAMRGDPLDGSVLGGERPRVSARSVWSREDAGASGESLVRA